MKQFNFTFPHFVIVLSVVLLSLGSCSTDIEQGSISEIEKNTVTFEKISFNTLLQQIKSDKIKSNLQMVKENLTLTAGRGIELDTLYFTKIVKENEYTTYLLELNSYSKDEPYFLKYVITQTDREEKAGYLKYIPDHEIPYIEPTNFTGTIQMLDDTFTIRSENYFITSIAQESQGTDAEARGIDGCSSSTRIIPHNCGHSGNHPPGEACGDGNFYSYFEIKITVICPDTFPTYDNSPFPNQLIDIGGPSGGGGSNATTPNPNNAFNTNAYKLYRSLSSTQKEWWNNVATPSIKNDIIQYLEQNITFNDNGMVVFDEETLAFVKELIDLTIQDTTLDSNAVSFVIKAKSQNLMASELNDDFLQSVDHLLELDTTGNDPIVVAQIKEQIRAYFTAKCAAIRYFNPNMTDLEVYYEASKDLVHIALDIFGLIPVVGEIADLSNGVLYLVDGDGINASLSIASAVPIAGWAATGAKCAIKIVDASQTASTIATKVKLFWKVLPNGLIYFGSDSHCRSTLRKVLGLAVGNANKAHHIIPLNLQTNIVVQRAAKSGSAFHMNEALNGISLSSAVHNGSHGAYDGKIAQKLNDFITLNPNANPDQCYVKVNQIIEQIRTAIQNNPGTPINQLNF